MFQNAGNCALMPESNEIPRGSSSRAINSQAQWLLEDASLAVRPIAPIKVKEAFENGEDVFTEQRSVLFKRSPVSRFWDAPHKSFVYVVWTARFINAEFDCGGGGSAVGESGARYVADGLCCC